MIASAYRRGLVGSRCRRVGIRVLHGRHITSYVEVQKRGSVGCVATIIYVYILSIFLLFARHGGIITSPHVLLTWLLRVSTRIILSGLFLVLLYSVNFVVAALTAKAFRDKHASDN